MPVRPINYDNFHMAFGGVHTLTIEWMSAARNENDVFKSLMPAWVALNSWTTCVTNVDRDTHIIKILLESGRFTNSFSIALQQNNTLQNSVRKFSEYLPIYDGREYRRKAARLGVPILDEMTAFNALGDAWNIPKLPPNWMAGNQSSLRDCLQAIYKVRCNLFHGQKQQTHQGDTIVVRMVRDVLVGFIAEAQCLTWRGAEQVNVKF